MRLLDAILHDLEWLWLAFKMKWLRSGLEYLDRQIETQETTIAECDAEIAAKENRA